MERGTKPANALGGSGWLSRDVRVSGCPGVAVRDHARAPDDDDIDDAVVPAHERASNGGVFLRFRIVPVVVDVDDHVAERPAGLEVEGQVVGDLGFDGVDGAVLSYELDFDDQSEAAHGEVEASLAQSEAREVLFVFEIVVEVGRQDGEEERLHIRFLVDEPPGGGDVSPGWLGFPTPAAETPLGRAEDPGDAVGVGDGCGSDVVDQDRERTQADGGV